MQLKQRLTNVFFVLILGWLGGQFSVAAENRFLVFQIINPKPARECGKLMGYVSVMEQRSDGTTWVKYQFPTIYGINGCDKRWKGDKRTPLGKYRIKAMNKKSLTNPTEKLKFGGHSLVLDYPNAHDRREGLTGDGIAIHGGRVGGTLGCARVLDGSQENPELGIDNIRRVAQVVERGVKVIFAENIESELMGSQDAPLSSDATLFWNNVLKADLSRQELLSWVNDFRNHLNPSENPIENPKPENPPVIIEPDDDDTPEPPTIDPFEPTPTPSNKPDIKPARKISTTIKAVDFLNGNTRYAPSRISDGSESTAWCLTCNAKQKWLKFDFSEKQTVKGINILTGYNKTIGREDRWKQNGRALTLRLTFDSGKSQILKLKDTRQRQRINLAYETNTKSVKVEVISLVKGTTFKHDFCISELKFY